ncbi:MAG: response regulator, partial [Desulfobulbaceae bacterium]|nr:response regulator [Desulfobulbaceae bacterium]
VFESFTQADSSHSRRFGGTGLGVSISKGLVELMGGTIWFESEPGRGPQFSFTVPLVTLESSGLVDSREEEPALRPDDGSLEGDGWHILVAEDEYINKILIRTLLQQAGYHVTVVQNGREAVEAWRGGVFDCILMDIQMPFMDGYEAVARIRAQEQEGEHIPVIAMTAHAMSGDRQKCLQAGMDDYLAKPIDGRAVLALLRRFLRDRSAPADSEGERD